MYKPINKIDILSIEGIMVARVRSEGGPAEAKKAFDVLESRMHGLKGRKMYGVFYPRKNEYFACVKLDNQFPDDMGFERSTISGGEYAYKKIENWSSKTQEIASIFKQLEKNVLENRIEIDLNRPSIEFYRSFRELICMLPVKR